MAFEDRDLVLLVLIVVPLVIIAATIVLTRRVSLRQPTHKRRI
jgi:hypothetical protein